MGNSSYKEFYKNIDRKQIYSSNNTPEQHKSYSDLKQFIDKYDLTNKYCLEIGASKGVFQNIITNYSGLDISESLSKYFKKPFFTVNNDGSYPFNRNVFDAIWAIDVHEHIQDINQALIELKRVLKPGGVVYFAPAWQCRPWAAEGYAVRPFSDFAIRGKIIKALIPLRDSVSWRSFFIFPKRTFYHLSFLFGKKYCGLKYKKLNANYDIFWTSDSDACNSIDPHDAILWFLSNGFECLSHPLHLKALFVRNSPLIFRKIAQT
jgi:SAM-dependent methyltransferase